MIDNALLTAQQIQGVQEIMQESKCESYKLIQFNEPLLNSKVTKFSLPIMEGVPNVTYRLSFSEAASGINTWVGKGQDNETLIVSRGDGYITGFFTVNNRYYSFLGFDNYKCVLFKHLPESDPEWCGNALNINELNPGNKAATRSNGSSSSMVCPATPIVPFCPSDPVDCNPTIDILILGDINTATAYVSKLQVPNPALPGQIVPVAKVMKLITATQVAALNQACKNSNMGQMKFRGIYESFDPVSIKFAYQPQQTSNLKTSASPDLNNFAGNSYVNSIADYYGADIVVLVTGRNYGPLLGLANLNGNNVAMVTLSAFNSPLYTFPHEVAIY